MDYNDFSLGWWLRRYKVGFGISWNVELDSFFGVYGLKFFDVKL